MANTHRHALSLLAACAVLAVLVQGDATVSVNGTIYQRYWDIATAAYVNSTIAYTAAAAIPFTNDRAYVSTRIEAGTV